MDEQMQELCRRVTWHKSYTSNPSGNCVEIAQLSLMQGALVRAKPGAAILVRDSRDPDGPVLAFTQPEWDAFGDGLRARQPELVGAWS